MTVFGLLWALLGCSEEKTVIDLEIVPTRLYFGEVSFDGEMPEEGRASDIVTILNEGQIATSLTLVAYDEDHLCIAGFPDPTVNASLGIIEPGASYVLTIAICDYLPGEATTEVETEVVLLTDGEPPSFSIPIYFTPTRGGTDDTVDSG